MSAADLAKIRARNLKNALRKLEQNRTLTPSEMRMVEAAGASTDPVDPAGLSPGATSGKPPSSYASMKQAAAALHLPLWLLKTAKDAGCGAFRANRVYRSELLTWLDEHPEAHRGTSPGGVHGKKEELLGEQIRKLRLRNDADEGRLIQRAFVAERFQRMAGELNAIRAKSEAEHPLRFAACGQNVDVPRCRTVLRGVWDEILAAMSRLGDHLEEPAPATPPKAA